MWTLLRGIFCDNANLKDPSRGAVLGFAPYVNVMVGEVEPWVACSVSKNEELLKSPRPKVAGNRQIKRKRHPLPREDASNQADP